MPRDYRPREKALKSKARRDHALARRDLREPSTPRQPAASPTSFAVKARDPAAAAAIEAFLARREGGR